MPSPFEWLGTIASRKHLSKSRVNDIKTSLHKLADATGVEVDALDLRLIETSYVENLHNYFRERAPQASAYTRRNTVQNLKQFYRLLHDTGLLTKPIAPQVKRPGIMESVRKMSQTSPYHNRFSNLPRYRCTSDQWPPTVCEEWERFSLEYSLQVRPSTMKSYTNRFHQYMSYNLTADRSPVTSWDDLFDGARLLRFITWHAKRVGEKRISTTGRMIFNLMTTIAKHDNRPDFTRLRERESKLPTVEPMHNKQSPEHTMTAKELENVALALLAQADTPLTAPHAPSYIRNVKRPGLTRAGKRRDALLLRLMWRVPLRSRSICEMELGKNLLKDHQGQWVLQYIGEQLKIGHRGGRINSFRAPFPSELVSHLEDYLQWSRPLLPNANTDRHVFLTQRGRPFEQATLRLLLASIVYQHLGKRLYPHLLRTLWVDQYLLSTDGDISTAAFWLNDTPQTVLKRYHELRGEEHSQKALNFNQRLLGNGTTR